MIDITRIRPSVFVEDDRPPTIKDYVSLGIIIIIFASSIILSILVSSSKVTVEIDELSTSFCDESCEISDQFVDKIIIKPTSEEINLEGCTSEGGFPCMLDLVEKVQLNAPRPSVAMRTTLPLSITQCSVQILYNDIPDKCDGFYRFNTYSTDNAQWNSGSYDPECGVFNGSEGFTNNIGTQQSFQTSEPFDVGSSNYCLVNLFINRDIFILRRLTSPLLFQDLMSPYRKIEENISLEPNDAKVCRGGICVTNPNVGRHINGYEIEYTRDLTPFSYKRTISRSRSATERISIFITILSSSVTIIGIVRMVIQYKLTMSKVNQSMTMDLVSN
jgi:hypothetical protein